MLPDNFFSIISFPAGIFEYNISDPYNIIIFKYYTIYQDADRFVGNNVMTANQNYILHLLLDIVTYQNILRVFSRTSFHNSIARYQFILQSTSKTNFFFFPNLYLDILWFRDERKINITTLQDQEFLINGTLLNNSFLLQTVENQQYTVTLHAQNSNNKCYDTNFKVTFLDSKNTSVFLFKQNNSFCVVDIFYNCGDQKFEYELTDLFIGPNYNLKISDEEDNII